MLYFTWLQRDALIDVALRRRPVRGRVTVRLATHVLLNLAEWQLARHSEAVRVL